MNLLILSYHFPPHPTVGSRRWAKFAKFFARMGHRVTVITSQAPKGSISPWDDDIQEGITVHRLPYRYPRILDSHPKTFFEKLCYKIVLFLLEHGISGTPYDRAIFWKSVLMKELRKVIQKEGLPDFIFANGPPFRLLYYTGMIKKLYPTVKIAIDFRDPWTWWYNMGYPYLNSKDRKAEEKMESFAVQSADQIITPCEEIQKKLAVRYPEFKSKIEVIPHGFDPDKVTSEERRTTHSPPHKLIYFGTLYVGIDRLFYSLTSVLDQFPNPVTLDLYVSRKKYFFSSSRVQYLSPVSEKVLFEKICGYDLVVLFLFQGVEDFLGTKLFEVIHSRTPILLLGPSGKVSQFIVENDLGFHIRTEDIEAELPKILSGQKVLKYNNRFDTSPYSFESLTKQLLQTVHK